MNRTNVFVIDASALALGACAMPEFEGSALGGKDPATSSKAKEQGDAECSSVALTPEDPAKYPKFACAKGGGARCIPKGKVPSNVSGQLETCTEGGAGACVPDKLVKSGGAALKTSNSAFGDGRCMNLCVLEVADKQSLLNRGEGDVCDQDERCVPCLNPLKNNEPTGVCEIGKPAPAPR